MKTKMLLVASALAVAGCASHPDGMQPASVSDVAYKNHSCEELAMEAKRINARLGELYNLLRTTANNDNAQMIVGSLVFFPALFFLEGGNGPEAVEYAQLRGESEVVRATALRKKCGLDIQTFSPSSVGPARSDPDEARKRRCSYANPWEKEKCLRGEIP